MKYLIGCIIVAICLSCQKDNHATHKMESSMTSTIALQGKQYSIDLNHPIDISLSVQNQAGVGAWYIDQPKISHVVVDGYVGKVSLGGSTNFNDIFFNPHSHGTHTECIGHITEEFYSVNQTIVNTFFTAQLLSVTPEIRNDDAVITAAMFANLETVEAVVIRTLPNLEDKKTTNYSNTNPPYLLEEAMIYLREKGVKHVLVDLPSVDKEKDGGALLAHKAFWDFDGKPRMDATITEFVFVPSTVADGLFILDLQIAPIENDAAPSRPLLYTLKE